MTANIHRLSGLALAAAAFLALSHQVPQPALLAVMLGMVPGSTAPDWLEMRWWVGQTRLSLIPHRTITHWVLLWVIALTGSYWHAMTSGNLLSLGFCGFAAGALLHCLMDATTPTGVPFFNPLSRVSLRGEAR